MKTDRKILFLYSIGAFTGTEAPTFVVRSLAEEAKNVCVSRAIGWIGRASDYSNIFSVRIMSSMLPAN